MVGTKQSDQSAWMRLLPQSSNSNVVNYWIRYSLSKRWLRRRAPINPKSRCGKDRPSWVEQLPKYDECHDHGLASYPMHYLPLSP